MRNYLPHILIISFIFLLASVVYSAEENPHESLDDMLAIIEKKEKEKENQARQLEAYLHKYEKIVSSEFGRDMKKTAWNNLVSRYPEASGLAVGDISGFLKLFATDLRSSYKTLSLFAIQSMPHIFIRIRKEDEWGFFGHSTVNHYYNLKTIEGDKVVVDHATGLMWHQSGSDKMSLDKAKKWIKKLNKKRSWSNNEDSYAGYQDWRLPTAEEVVSLLEPSKKNGNLYIDPVFSRKEQSIWTGDKCDYIFKDTSGAASAWSVDFRSGGVGRNPVSYNFHCVRPVRSVK